VVEADEVLRDATTVLVVDWPSRDVPVTLAAAGYTVVVNGGPGPEDYTACQVRDGEVVDRHLGQAPAHADLVYSHRPLEELPGIVAVAREIGARTVWVQSGLVAGGAKDPRGCWLPEAKSQEGRGIVESAGLAYVDDVYIADAVRRLGIHKS
jgi:predicted CoA-binding protein